MNKLFTFAEFISDMKITNSINETVFSSGLGGNLNYNKKLNIKTKTDVINWLKTKKWQKTEPGKFAINQSTELSKSWNEKGVDNLPTWAKDGLYAWTIKDGIIEDKNFLYETPLIVAYLDYITKRQSAKWVDSGLQQNLCFRNAIQWSKENDTIPIGGIIIENENLKTYNVESLICHAFVENKQQKFIEVTAPRIKTTGLIYWKFFEYTSDYENEFSELIWNKAISIEAGVKEYIKNYYETNQNI